MRVFGIWLEFKKKLFLIDFSYWKRTRINFFCAYIPTYAYIHTYAHTHTYSSCMGVGVHGGVHGGGCKIFSKTLTCIHHRKALSFFCGRAFFHFFKPVTCTFFFTSFHFFQLYFSPPFFSYQFLLYDNSVKTKNTFLVFV